MFDMEIMMGYSAVNRRQSMTSRNSERTNRSEKSAGTERKNASAPTTEAEKSASAGQTAKTENAVKAYSSYGTDFASIYGEEVDFAVSGRARDVAVQTSAYLLQEQNAYLNEIEQGANEETKKSGKKEETAFQKKLREMQEQAIVARM